VLEEVKYLVHYEFNPEDFDKVIPLFQKMQELRQKGSNDYPKSLTPTYGIVGGTTGFFIAEVENSTQMTNHYLHYHPIIQFTWEPIEESATVITAYMKKKH